MVKLAILDDYQEVALKMADWNSLPAGTEVMVFKDHISDKDELVKRLEEFQIISTMRERTPFGRDLLSGLPNLKLLVTTGMHNAAIDLDAAVDLGILVCGTGGPTAPGLEIDMSDVVELTWGLILSLARRIPWEDNAIRKGHWQTSLGTGLRGKTLGILGLGNLGSQVAGIGRAFGMSLIAWSQNLTAESAAQQGATLVTKDEIFASADVLTIHLRLSDRTRYLVGEHELGLMKPTSYLINTSRGPIVDEKALIKALTNHSIGGTGLDVFDQEPLPAEHPFTSLDNVILTPHIGYVSERTYRVFYKDTVEDILGYLEGRPLRVMNPALLEKTYRCQ